ncbi:MAG: trigger factor [Anaerolineales bacterium]|nr:trigger factor [Anaerolineales bacterium]
MKVETEDLENRQVQLTVEVPGERVQAAMRSAARRLSKQTRIPGFRPGKAPYEIIVGRFGEDSVFEEALDNLGQEIYRQALEDSAIEPYAPGTLEEIVSREPLVLRYMVPLAPDVELGDYKEVRIPHDDPEVTDEEFEKALEDLRQSRALIEPAERAAELSDVVIADIKAELREPEDEEEAVILDMKGVEILVDEATDWPIPGIVAYLVGVEADNERVFEYTFPEDYPVERLRQRTADFHLKALEVKSRLVPEWSDDLAQSIGDFEDLLDLRLKLRESMLESAKHDVEANYAQQVIETVVNGSTLAYPPVLLDEEIEELVSDLSRRLTSQNLTLDDYLKIEAKTREDLREELRPQAEERLARALVLGKLVELEELEVEEAEINDKIDQMVQPFKEQAGELRKVFDNPQGRHRVRLDLLTEKAINRIVAISKGEWDQANPETLANEGKDNTDTTEEKE